MTTQPMVSIVIPVYNGADFLSQAIECALWYGTLIAIINCYCVSRIEARNIMIDQASQGRLVFRPDWAREAHITGFIEAGKDEVKRGMQYD
jgi:hypothetical protein